MVCSALAIRQVSIPVSILQVMLLPISTKQLMTLPIKHLKEYTRKTEPLYEQEGSVRGDLDQDMQVREAFFSLSDEERFIVAMQVFGGYKSKEIGLILHKNHNTVRSRLNRALKKMEEILQ